jgi:RHS repeat-associated protein
MEDKMFSPILSAVRIKESGILVEIKNLTLYFKKHNGRAFYTRSKQEVNVALNVADTYNTTGQWTAGYTYDALGNVLTATDARGVTITNTYDGENKQVKVEVLDANGNPASTIGEYFYDGDGKRVKKFVPSTGETTIFVYDASGKMLAEYSTIVEPPSMAKVSYLTSDHLGSPRILTDASGNVISRRDFHPFGEEIITAQRTQGLGYTADSVRQKFTSYERDNEAGLDYAKNRYYNFNHGRFTSVDPYNIIFEKEKGKNEKEKLQIFLIYISQPQIWNKYSYSVNNPLKFTDPDGRRPITEQEKRNIQNFIQSGIDYANSVISDPKEREAFIQQVRNAATVIENAILAVSNDAKEDPKNLRAVLWAIGKIGDTGFNSDGTKYINSNGITVTFGPGTNKCNLFVAAAYVLGANIGFRTSQNPQGYQINSGWRNYRVPVANDLVTSGMTNFEANSSPQLGDVAAGRGTVNEGYLWNSYNTGHTGIVVSGEVVISANPIYGVRVGRFSPTSDPNSGFTYLRYKP